MGLFDPNSIDRPGINKGQQHQGHVVDNKDPKKAGRVKIRVPVLHRNVPDEDLPWVRPAASGSEAQGGAVGSNKIPAEGSRVTMLFEDDDPHNASFSGSPTTPDAHQNEMAGDPDRYGYVDEAGNKLEVNTKENTASFTHVSGATISIGAGGEVSVTSAGDSSFNINGNLDILVSGNANLHAGGVLNLAAAQIHENSNGPTGPSAASPRSRPTIPSQKGKTEL